MKLFAVSLLATASAANASLRGGPVVLSKAVLSAVPAIPAPFSFLAGSIGDGDGRCEAETRQIWQKTDLNAAIDGHLNSCDDYNVDIKSNASTLNYPPSDATIAASTCSCEFAFHLEKNYHLNLTLHSTIIAPTASRGRQAVHLRRCMLRDQWKWLVSWLVYRLKSSARLHRDKLHHGRFQYIAQRTHGECLSGFSPG